MMNLTPTLNVNLFVLDIIIIIIYIKGRPLHYMYANHNEHT